MTVVDFPGPDRRLTESATDTELQACVRDLMHLLSLPAMWHGKDPDWIQRQLCETLEATLSVEACFVCTRLAAGEPLACVLRIRGAFVDAANPAWRCLVDAAAQPHSGPPSMIDDTPVGALRMISYDMGFFGEGSVCVASSDPGFPTATQALVLKAAVTLAASGLQSARLLREKEETRRAREAFLALLGHELRNPLAPIVTALDLIKLRARAELPREVEIIDRQVGRLARLVDEMVDLSRLGRGKITLAKEPVEMSVVVAKAIERVSASIEQRRHALRVDVPASGLTVEGDPARLAQIVRHLLDNAAKYTPPGGKIAVTAWREDGHIKLTVTDNGMGIDSDVLPRLFDPFQDPRTNVERAPGGLGIGLAIASRLADLHGGAVSASSEGRGRGSEFVVTLPAHVSADSAKHSETAPRAHDPVRRERVVVVDDNRDAAELVADVLSSAGHDVSVAHDALQALSLIARVKPGVVVLDIGLPVMDGYELASRIREAFGENSPRLVAVTGFGLDEDRARSRDIGIDTHLVKPVDVQKLIEAVGGPLRGPSAGYAKEGNQGLPRCARLANHAKEGNQGFPP
jgi:signal transduction histidine kinase/FixJ family two-component response regulator